MRRSDVRFQPLNRLSPTQAYATSPGQEAALRLIEAWCGGKLAGLLQLTQGRLRALLDAIAGEPLVYWVKRPQEPIAWEGDRLPGRARVFAGCARFARGGRPGGCP